MAFPKIKEVRQLNDEQLSDKIIELKKQLANLRLLKATGRLEKPHEFKHTQHQLAQLFTVERERQQQAEAEESATPEPELAAASSAEEA